MLLPVVKCYSRLSGVSFQDLLGVITRRAAGHRTASDHNYLIRVGGPKAHSLILWHDVAML